MHQIRAYCTQDKHPRTLLLGGLARRGRGREEEERRMGRGGRLNWRLIAGTDRTGVVLIGKGQGFI